MQLEAPLTGEQRFPRYKGCSNDLTNTELKKCSIKKIQDFLKVSFDYEMADRVFQTKESTKFQLEFMVNKKGRVEHINVKAMHKAIAIEVIKLAKRLPKFKSPGTINGIPVKVPIKFEMTVFFQ